MTRILFLRHGKARPRAGWRGDDDMRPLTPDGERAMLREAACLARLELAPEVIVTSPLVRARHTAEIVAEALRMADRLLVDDRLGHGFGARRLAELVAARPAAGEMLVVGHEPDLGATVSELIGGGRVVLKKGGLARVDVDLVDGSFKNGELVWLLTPSSLGVG